MTAGQQPVGLAIIGAGLMAGQHHASTVAVDEIDVRGVFAADTAQARELTAGTDATVYESLDSVLADDTGEGVLVATPTDTHVDIALAALAAGRHVFVEKPVARTLDGAEQLRDAGRAHGLVVQSGHVIRYFPEYRALHDAIRAGDVGTPAVATFGRRCQQPDWAPDHWHTNMARSGGVAVDMLIHDVDLVRWMFGEPTEVFARVVGSDRFNGLDYALATLTVPDGPICHLHGSWAEPAGFSQSAEICGTRGMLTYDSRGRAELDVAAHAAHADSVTALPPPPPGPDNPFARQLRDFAAAVRGGPEPPGSIDWAIGSLRVALAMLESSDTGEVVRLGAAEVLA